MQAATQRPLEGWWGLRQEADKLPAELPRPKPPADRAGSCWVLTWTLDRAWGPAGESCRRQTPARGLN